MMMKILSFKMTHTMLVVHLVVIVLAVGFHLAAMVVDMMRKMDWLKIEKLWNLHPHYTEDRKIKLASSEFDGYALRWWDAFVRNRDEDGVKTIDEYYMEMEMLMQRGRVRESLEMTMQRFLNGLNKDQRTSYRRWAFHTPHGPIYGAGAFDALRPYSTPPSKSVSNVSNTKKSESAASHFKRDFPNRKVMIINEDNEYETGDDVDPNAPEDDDYDTDGEDAYPSYARTIVVSQRALN
ncbi:hypothetical protein QYE76_016672, partial [Lolium multiflorum]